MRQRWLPSPTFHAGTSSVAQMTDSPASWLQSCAASGPRFRPGGVTVGVPFYGQNSGVTLATLADRRESKSTQEEHNGTEGNSHQRRSAFGRKRRGLGRSSRSSRLGAARLQIHVSGNAVHIMDLKVIYANGAPDDIQVRSEIREGGETRPLDLRGRERAIDRVELIYRAKPNFRGTAKVCVSGLE
jgi:hypothetical protein